MSPGVKSFLLVALTIPAALAYGKKGSGSKIPPNSTLIFLIDLHAVS